MASNDAITVPKFEAPLTDPKTGIVTRAWYLPLLRLFNPGPEEAVPLTGSPFTYHATQAGSLLVIGGTVSGIQLVRNQAYATGVTSGFVPVSNDDQVILTYTVAPTVIFFPR